MPQRPKQHEIDERAQTLFRSLIPPAWVRNELHPDYGKDYVVEVFRDGKPAGLEFYVQLKGTEKLRRDGQNIRFRLQWDHLAYYLRQARLPVFLMLMDVARGCGYYCFLQGYLQEKRIGIPQKVSGFLLLKIPASNLLSDMATLEKQVESARQFMMTHSIRMEEWRMQAIDPRFEVKINASGGKSTVALRAREPVNINVAFAPTARPEDIRDFGRGYAVPVAPGTCMVTGTPLLKDRTITSIQASFSKNPEAVLVAHDKTGREIRAIPGIVGKLTGGMEEFQFQGEIPGSPLSLAIQGRRKDGGIRVSAEFRFGFSKWVGRSLVRLGHFETVKSLLELFQDGARFSIEGILNSGMDVGVIPFDDDFRSMLRVVEALSKAMTIARHFGTELHMPASISAEDLTNIDLLFNLVTTRRYEGAFGVRKVTLQAALRDGNAPVFQEGAESPLELNGVAARYRILGSEFELDGLAQTITKVSFGRLTRFEEKSLWEAEMLSAKDSIMVIDWGGTGSPVSQESGPPAGDAPGEST